MPAPLRYKMLTGAQPCFTPSLCWNWESKTSGSQWRYAGGSFDGVMFNAPLSSIERSTIGDLRGRLSLAVTANLIHAESHASYALTRINRTVLNPCLFIRAEHWHCLGSKSHGGPRQRHTSDIFQTAAVRACVTPDGCQFRGACSVDNPCPYGRVNSLWTPTKPR